MPRTEALPEILERAQRDADEADCAEDDCNDDAPLLGGGGAGRWL